MYKIIIFSIVILLTVSCKTQLKVNNEQTKSPAHKQFVNYCKIPLNITADSLSKLIQLEILKRFKEDYRFSTYDSFAINKYIDCRKRGIKLDEAIKECQSYLLKKLGSYVYCNYLFVMFNTFKVYENNNVEICFGFSLPNLKANHKSIWSDSLLDETSICFNLPYQKDSSLVINYPKLPDCANTKDCGFTISNQMAIDTLYKTNFLHIGDIYNCEITDEYEWQFTKRLSDQEQIIKINIRTGFISPIQYRHKID